MLNRGKQIVAASYLAFSCLVSCLGAALPAPPTESASPTVAEPHDTQKADESLYILQERNGCIGVYTPDGTLVQEVDIPLLSLPPADRRMLSQGIPLSSEEDLWAILQDYGG